MSLQSFKKKLEEMRGEYAFDFSKADDQAYLLDEFGGEDHMKEKFPTIYESFCRARQAHIQIGVNAQDECSGTLDQLQLENLRQGTDTTQYATLSAAITFAFIDSTKTVASEEPASGWVGLSIVATVKEVGSQQILVRSSKVVREANSYAGKVSTEPFPHDELVNKRYLTTVDITGQDPAGNLKKKVLQVETQIGETEEFNIQNISVEDPAPKTSSHKDSQKIMMLYGRINEQGIFQDADYKGDDYYNNTFNGNKVHLLIPIKGVITYACGVEPQGLYYSESEAFTRSEATYDYKGQKFIYRGDSLDKGYLYDAELYEKLKGCFEIGKYEPGIPAKVAFDIKISESGRSSLDWHTDVEGEANGEPKEIMLVAKFSYEIKDTIGSQAVDMITIRSLHKEDLPVIGREYYKFKRGSNTIYIPPITVYWGCLGKDTKVQLNGGKEKCAKDIRIGDKICCYDGRALKVKDIVHGKDCTIYHIKTENGASIMASGGHPIMCEGNSRRVCKLQVGDCLDLVSGGQDKIVEIEQIPYDDMVYCFAFEDTEEGVYMAADGFWVGDLLLQNTKINRKKEKTALNESKLAFIEEMECWTGEWQ